MTCRACNKLLSEFESTRKVVRDDGTIEYIDLCNKCYRESGLGDVATVVERSDLLAFEDMEEENEDFVDFLEEL